MKSQKHFSYVRTPSQTLVEGNIGRIIRLSNLHNWQFRQEEPCEKLYFSVQ